jgi:hypothetical protein
MDLPGLSPLFLTPRGFHCNLASQNSNPAQVKLTFSPRPAEIIRVHSYLGGTTPIQAPISTEDWYLPRAWLKCKVHPPCPRSWETELSSDRSSMSRVDLFGAPVALLVLPVAHWCKFEVGR